MVHTSLYSKGGKNSTWQITTSLNEEWFNDKSFWKAVSNFFLCEVFEKHHCICSNTAFKDTVGIFTKLKKISTFQFKTVSSLSWNIPVFPNMIFFPRSIQEFFYPWRILRFEIQEKHSETKPTTLRLLARSLKKWQSFAQQM